MLPVCKRLTWFEGFLFFFTFALHHTVVFVKALTFSFRYDDVWDEEWRVWPHSVHQHTRQLSETSELHEPQGHICVCCSFDTQYLSLVLKAHLFSRSHGWQVWKIENIFQFITNPTNNNKCLLLNKNFLAINGWRMFNLFFIQTSLQNYLQIALFLMDYYEIRFVTNVENWTSYCLILGNKVT